MALLTSQKKLNRQDTAPDFNLEGVDGKMYSLADFSGREGILIVFICNHCPYVIAKVDALKKLQSEFKDQVAIVGINSNDPEYLGEGMENMRKFVQKHEIEFPYLMDNTQEIAKAYGAVCTPDPFLFDKNNRLVFHGKINNAMSLTDEATEGTMRNNIVEMLRGGNIEKWFDPSQGCSIKWK